MEKRAAGYLRVSTTEQTGGMESQERVLRQYCEQNGITNVEFFSDHGISGTKSSRPALDRMMAGVESGEIGTVIVYSFSRFARSTTHLLNALQIFKRKGVQFISLTEKIDTSTAVGIAIFSLTGESIPDKLARCNPSEPITFGITFDPNHMGPARLEVLDAL